MFKKKKKITLSNSSNNSQIIKSIEFLSWAQEFSKIIVLVTFILFFVSNVFVLIMITFQFITTNEIMSIDTYIAEVHSTFREIIGGYLLKATFENVIKIGGGYLKSHMESKLPNNNIVEEEILAEDE